MPLPTRIAVLLLSLGFCGLAFSDSDSRPIAHSSPAQIAVTPADSSDLLKFGEREMLTTMVAMTSGDFNGDGWADLFIAEKDSSSAVLWLNDQTGHFTRGPVVALAGTPIALAAGDLSGDSRLDLVASLATGGGTVAILSGNGAGGFAAPVTLPIGGTPAYLRLGNLDAGGQLDLVVSNSSSTTVAVLLNQGGLAFSTTHYAAGDSPQGVALGDFDHDGILDLAVGASGPSLAVVSILIGNGDGTFAPRVEYPVGGAMLLSELEAGDLDGDTYDDIVMAFAIQAGIGVLWNNGSGALLQENDYGLVSGTTVGAEIVIGDLDGDGTLDIAATDVKGHSGLNWISLWFNQGSRTFDTSVRYWVGTGPGFKGSPSPKTLLGIAEVDHVGRQDLIVGLNYRLSPMTELLVIHHRVGRLFDGMTEYTLAGGVGPLAAVDFDADGKDGLLMSRSGHLWRIDADPNGFFAPPMDIGPGALAAAMDLNNDGRTDVLQRASAPMSISLCQPSGVLAPPIAYASRFRSTGDFDGDGFPDVLGEGTGGMLETLFNNGTGHFAAPTPATVGSLGSPIGTGDMDGDGNDDLVIARKLYVYGVAPLDSLTVFRSNGDGTFAFLKSGVFPPRFPNGNEHQALERVLVADLSGDNDLDAVVVTRFYAGRSVLYVLLGDGSGGFGEASWYDAVQEDAEVGLVDADDDGDLDMVVLAHTGEGVGQLQVFANRGNGTFSAPFLQVLERYPGQPGVEFYALPVVTGDFDANGTPDVAFPYGDPGYGGIGVFLGRFTDAPTPVAISLVDATADADGVHLAWEGTAAGPAQVQRRTAVAWSTLATLAADGNGRYTFEDREVEPGTRYGYRLQFGEGAQTQYTEATFVDVPLAAALQLERPSPNPSLGNLRVSFTLSSRAPAMVEMTDVAGRRVRSVSLASPETGRQTVDLSRGGRLAPGLYWVRLTQREESAVTRVVVLR